MTADEGAHYVTGLMLRDYVTTGFPASPLVFAKNYYLHYPEVAFGHWPPLFYVLQACWTLLAGVTYTSLLLFMAFLTATTALVLDVLAAGGLIAGVLYVAFPVTQEYASSLMAEAPLALFTLLSLIALIRFLERETGWNAVIFGVAVSAAILTKPSGWAIPMTPILALLLLRSPRRLFSPRLIAAGTLVAVCCAPYYYLTLRMASAGMEGRAITVSRFSGAFLEYMKGIPAMTGYALLVLAICGFIWRVVLPIREGRLTVFWAVMTSFVAAVILFHSLVPTTPEPRKEFMMLPGILLFAVAGAQWIARSKPAIAAAIMVAAFALGPVSIVQRSPARFASAATYLLSRPDLRNAAALVCSPIAGAEGAFIAEAASRDSPRPNRFLLRSSKILMRSTWNLLNYRSLFSTPSEMSEALDKIPIGALIVDTPDSSPLQPHERMLLKMLEANASDWDRIYADSGIAIYKRTADLSNRPIHVEMDLSDKRLGVFRSGP